MAEYEITAPDGRRFRVSGPGTRDEALAQVQASYQQDAPPPSIEPPKTQTEGVMRRIFPESLGQAGKEIGRAAALTARTGANLVAGLPLMAADFGVAVRNVGENVVAGRPLLQQTREMPSQMFRRGLNQAGVPEHETTTERVSDFVGQMALGTKLPVPSVRNPAPANFVPQSQQALTAANRVGYVVPPATARPNSVTAGIAEGAAGKLTTAQRASAANQAVTNRLAGQAVGIADDGTVSREALQVIRSEAGKAHEALRNFGGQITSDTQFRVELADAVRSFANTAKQIPALAQDDVLNIAKGLEQPRFDPGVAVDAISLLRDRADVAFRGGDRTLGRSYRALSDAFEGLVERRVSASGPQGAGMVDAFRSARQLIAKTYSIEGALRGDNVDAQVLARALDKGKPLSGTLRDIAQFAQRYPKAARVGPATESLPMYSPLDYLSMGASVAGGAVSGEPAALAPFVYSAARPQIRNFLLSPAGQRLMVNGIPQNALRGTAGASIPVANALGGPGPTFNR